MKLGFCPEGTGKVYPFDAIFNTAKDISSGMEDVDAVVFWGGTDIHPSLYNQKSGRYTQQAGSTPMKRDLFEWKAMQYCKLNKIPMIGVCRGAQLMTAFVGGTLVQHTTGHHRDHDMITSDGRTIRTTSCHHQMMNPYGVEHELLAWTAGNRSSVYLDGDNKSIEEFYSTKEPEVVYYPQVRGLAIQGHPEWASKDSEFVLYVNQLVEDLLVTSMVS